MADKSSERRYLSNTFYLSLITALIAIIGILSQIEKPVSTLYFWWVALVSLAGIIFCMLWNTNINCYRQLSDAKFKVINELEEKLPVAAFATEWYCLKNGGKKKYPELTLIERRIPLMFLALFVILLIISLATANYEALLSLGKLILGNIR